MTIDEAINKPFSGFVKDGKDYWEVPIEYFEAVDGWLEELKWWRNQDLISRSEAWEKRPEWLNEDMYDINKSKENKGWNKCNKYWYEIIKQIPKAEPTSSILEQVQKGE